MSHLTARDTCQSQTMCCYITVLAEASHNACRVSLALQRATKGAFASRVERMHDVGLMCRQGDYRAQPQEPRAL